MGLDARVVRCGFRLSTVYFRLSTFRLFTFAFFIFHFAFVTSQAQTTVASTSSDYRIESGDTVEVIVAKRPELGWRGPVKEDGNIYSLPYLESPIAARCRTEVELAGDIADAYKRIVRDPKIVVRVVERSSRPAIILGAVKTPQRVQMNRSVNLNEMLAIAGGVTDRASGDIQIFHSEARACPTATGGASTDDQSLPAGSQLRVLKILELVAGNASANPTLRPGDIVTVMMAEPVYVTGAVISPQSLNFREPLTLSRAVQMAGGLTKEARGGDIRVYRRGANSLEQTEIKADLNAIKDKKQEDIPLKPYDIVVVPQSGGESRRASMDAQEIVSGEKRLDVLPLRVVN